MAKTLLPKIEMIRVDEIKIVNPRQRNVAGHAAIIENIRAIGLKRPITVRRLDPPEGKLRYALVIGQGRIGAHFDNELIAATITEASAEDGLLMGLIENVARRHRSSIEVMREISALRSRGHTHEGIAKIIGSTPSWVTGVLGLLEQGEERLVASVASGAMPMALAMRVAMGNSHELQAALAEAYETGVLRGKQLATVRQIIKLRERSKLLRPTAASAPAGTSRSWSPAQLLEIYEREAASRRLIVKKADVVQSMLAFTVEAFRQMLKDAEFVAALRAEKMLMMPAALAKLLDYRAEAA